jgi:hypothetical protein
MESTGSGYGLIVGPFKHGNEPGSIKVLEFLDSLNNHQLLKYNTDS